MGMALIGLCAKLSRSRAVDPRAEEDEAFVAKLGERETQAAEEIGSTISSPSFEETKK